jgi:transcriptional regulator with XRE-family HTH domain
VINIKSKKLIVAFGKHVRKLREDKELSMRHLADLADIAYSQLAKIETGKINTSISTAYALSKALEIPLEKLFKFEI